MFFVLSKVFWIFVQPSNLAVFGLIAGAAALFTRFARAGRALILACIAFLIVFGLGQGSIFLVAPLENRFPKGPDDFPAPTGIIVLGGGVDELTSATRGTLELSESGTRMTTSAALAHRYPQARLVFTGGSGRLTGAMGSESNVARQIYLGLGIDAARMTFEEESRNTWENAVFTRDLVKPKPGEVWLLLTSASHMPRSVGIFRKVGFDVVPWPVDYTTRGTTHEYVRPPLDVSSSLMLTDRAIREWIGLVAYWLTGKTSALFPAP